jgi:hypothetical protein|tara:strand:- start:513 stop:728 length:216 start_codon:yes stop_codon:yes gene_type:complete
MPHVTFSHNTHYAKVTPNSYQDVVLNDFFDNSKAGTELDCATPTFEESHSFQRQTAFDDTVQSLQRKRRTP